MAVNFAEFNQWGRMLAHCLNGNQTTAYLYTDGKVIQVVDVNDPCPADFKKMSLQEIISNSLVHCAFPDKGGYFRKFQHNKWVETQIKLVTSTHDIFNDDKTFDALLQEIRALPGTFDSMHQTLSTMCQKSQMKRTAQKTSGFWGVFLNIWHQIKFFIWNHFYNPSSQLKMIQNYRVSIATAVPEALKKVPEILKERVLINVHGFLEEINKQDENEIPIENHKDISSKFLVKYHSDKYQDDQGLSEQAKTQADTYRKRIIIIKNIWEQFEKGAFSSSLPAPKTSRNLLQ